MFEHLTKAYIQREAPSSVIPHCMTVTAVKKKYGFDAVYKLASNENPFGVSPKAAKAIEESIKTCHLYSDNSHEDILYGKLAALHDVTPSQIFIAGGAASVLSQIADVFLQEGTECIIPSPAYPPYYFWAYRNCTAIVDVPCNQENQTLDTEAVLAAVTPRTRLIFLCNPNNPSSTAISRDSLVSLISRLPRDVIAVVDEAYVDFADDPAGLTMIPCLPQFPNMIVVRTFSKLYGMASARLGYSVACQEITDYLNKAVASRGINCFGVDGGIAALDDVAFREKTIENNRVERQYLTEALTGLGFQVYHSQSNFIWVDFGRPASAVHDDLLPYGIIIRGDFPFARISIGLHHENERLVQALTEIQSRS